MAAWPNAAAGRRKRATRDAADRHGIGHIAFLLGWAFVSRDTRCAVSRERFVYKSWVPSWKEERDKIEPTTGARVYTLPFDFPPPVVKTA
jgi:hypothetical protein